MNYIEKYLKYKKKYLNLKAGAQYGNFTLHYSIKNSDGDRTVEAKDVNGRVVGEFDVDVMNNPQFVWLTLGIELNENVRGNGIAREMMKYMVQHLIESGFHSNTPICIDTDASFNSEGQSFWEHIGMTANPYFNVPSNPTYGYEKCFTLNHLVNYLNIDHSMLTKNHIAYF